MCIIKGPSYKTISGKKKHFERKPRLSHKQTEYEQKKIYCENSNKNFCCLSPQPSL